MVMTVIIASYRKWHPRLQQPFLKPLNVMVEWHRLWLHGKTTPSMLRGIDEVTGTLPGERRGLGVSGADVSPEARTKGQTPSHTLLGP